MSYGNGTTIDHLKLNGRILCRNPHASFACLSVAAFKMAPKQCKRCAAKMEKLPSERKHIADLSAEEIHGVQQLEEQLAAAASDAWQLIQAART